jgi:HK97 family phage prohead protease
MKKGIVTGYFSRFGNVDSDGDIIKAGAFAKTVKEQGPNSAQPRIKHLMNHNPSMPLGKLLSLKEDSTGLVYESQVGTHALGQDFIKMVESGLITEHSIGYRTIKRNQLQDYAGYQKNPSKGMFEITEAKLFEGSSLTAWGANPLTPLTGLKNAVNIDNIISQQVAIEKFCKDSTATDETIEMLLLHSKQLSQYILDIKVNQPAASTDPNKWQGWVTKLKTT